MLLLLAISLGASPAAAKPLLASSVLARRCPLNSMPEDWWHRCCNGNLLFSYSKASGTEFMPEVGNGHLAWVVFSNALYAAGFFSGDSHGQAGQLSHRAKLPRYSAWVAVSDRTEKHLQALDVERAAFFQRFAGPQGAPHVRVEERWYAPLHEPTMMVHEIELHNPSLHDQNVTIVRHKPKDTEDITSQWVPPEQLRALTDAGVGAYAIEGSNRVPETGNKTYFALAATTVPPTVSVAVGQTVKIYALTVVVTSLWSKDPTASAVEKLLYYSRDGFAKAAGLFDAHADRWKARSAAGRIEVVDDLELAQVINASLYFIRSSIRDDWAQGLSPCGLASNGYMGHTFWDQEMWMWPPLLMLEPTVARSLLQYRFDRMGAAREKAASCGRPGQSWCPPKYKERLAPQALMFPWESAHEGVEVQFQGGKLGEWGLYEQHISGDIAFAVRQYWYATRDRDWLAKVGFPLVNGTASFYAARLEPRAPGALPSGGKGGPAFDMNDVMGPDEYQFPIKNSAYTNSIVKITLEFAMEAAAALGFPVPDFKATSDGLFVPFSEEVPGRPELKGGYHPEYEGFPKDPSQPVVKQADAILLSYPLGVDDRGGRRALANDLDFYDGITDRAGPAMTSSMFAMGWLEVRNYTRVGDHFKRGYANAQSPYNVWTEKPRGSIAFPGCANFITGAGGFLQSVVYGTSGMRVRADGLHFSPPPPSATGTYAAAFVLHSLHYHGARLRQEVTEDGAYYELLEAGPVGAPRLCLLESDGPAQPLLVGRERRKYVVMGRKVLIRDCRAGEPPVAPPTHLVMDKSDIAHSPDIPPAAGAGVAMSCGFAVLALAGTLAVIIRVGARLDRRHAAWVRLRR